MIVIKGARICFVMGYGDSPMQYAGDIHREGESINGVAAMLIFSSRWFKFQPVYCFCSTNREVSQFCMSMCKI